MVVLRRLPAEGKGGTEDTAQGTVCCLHSGRQAKPGRGRGQGLHFSQSGIVLSTLPALPLLLHPSLLTLFSLPLPQSPIPTLSLSQRGQESTGRRAEVGTQSSHTFSSPSPCQPPSADRKGEPLPPSHWSLPRIGLRIALNWFPPSLSLALKTPHTATCDSTCL